MGMCDTYKYGRKPGGGEGESQVDRSNSKASSVEKLSWA